MIYYLRDNELAEICSWWHEHRTCTPKKETTQSGFQLIIDEYDAIKVRCCKCGDEKVIRP